VSQESPQNVEIPLAQSTSLILNKEASMKVRHMGREKYMRAADLRSLVRR
jgi:hypothetical protein